MSLPDQITELVIIDTIREVSRESSSETELIDDEVICELVTEGPRGPPGPPGPGAFISTDPNNMTSMGTDGGIFTPDMVADPLAYYILAKA